MTLTTSTNATEGYKLYEQEFIVGSIDQKERERIITEAQLLTHPANPLAADVYSNNGRRRRRSPSPQPSSRFSTATTAASIHSQNTPPHPPLSINTSNKRPYPALGEQLPSAGSGSRGSSALSFFERRKPSPATSLPPTSGSGTTSSKLGNGSGKSTTMRRPRTSTGAPSRTSTAASSSSSTAVGGTSIDELDALIRARRSTDSHSSHTLANSSAMNNMEDPPRSFTRRRLSDDASIASFSSLSSLNTYTPPLSGGTHLKPPGAGAPMGWEPSGMKSAKLGFEPDQVKAWEDELDRIATYSKRRSVAMAPPGTAKGEGSPTSSRRVSHRLAVQVAD